MRNGLLILKSKIIYLAILVLMANCARHESSKNIGQFTDFDKITGGQPVEKGDPFVKSTVAIYLNLESEEKVENYCTGTLIAPTIVLTAAHCFVDFSDLSEISISQLVEKSKVGFGTDIAKKLSHKNVNLINIERVEVHPFYVKGSVANATRAAMYDAALIFLKEKAPEYTLAARIVTNSKIIQSNLQVVAAGFGLLSRYPDVTAQQLMKVELAIDNVQINSAQFSYKVKEKKGICSGDSGGPAYITTDSGEIAVIGIASWGDFLCQQIGVFTSVPAVSSWINQKAPELLYFPVDEFL